MNAAEGRDVMTIAAYFHLRFEEIHAFADGNSRLGRTLLNYYLMLHDYPPLVFCLNHFLLIRSLICCMDTGFARFL
ncbi:MAG: Fic family protein [Lachnospiraceae bacterium]|nr:Fic family protein [Lachnospiraceae bacterium]